MNRLVLRKPGRRLGCCLRKQGNQRILRGNRAGVCGETAGFGGNYARLVACGTVDTLGVMQKQRLKFLYPNVSLSRYVGELLQKNMHEAREYEAAMKFVLSRKPLMLRPGERFLTRAEIYDRKRFR